MEPNESGLDAAERYLDEHWWLEEDCDFTRWLEFIDQQGEDDADREGNKHRGEQER